MPAVYDLYRIICTYVPPALLQENLYFRCNLFAVIYAGDQYASDCERKDGV